MTEREKQFEMLKNCMEQDKQHMLYAVAEELHVEFADFYESVNDEMDVVLGEIYREKIKNIGKILKRHGIDVMQKEV